jgi:hypothetical protein
VVCGDDACLRSEGHMSTDWNIKCLDCNVEHGFDNANHQDELMWTLIKHAGAIGALAPLLAEPRADVEFRTYWGRLDAQWFAEHATHRLVPISEYGHLATQCQEYVTCECGSMRRCALDQAHEGAHDARKP